MAHEFRSFISYYTGPVLLVWEENNFDLVFDLEF